MILPLILRRNAGVLIRCRIGGSSLQLWVLVFVFFATYFHTEWFFGGTGYVATISRT